jgi:4-cresol dehydrogenase (hydroxylating) flavoprotein subunit
MTPVLPPGFSEARLHAALADVGREIGEAWVDHAPSPPPEQLDPFALGDPLRFAPSAVVRPGSVEEIRAVLRVANEHRLPLWTVSLGKNLGYGGPAPRVRGSVVVELSRMDRVLEVDEELGYALLEPGVRFFDLYEHLRTNGHRLWMSAPGLGWGSIVGNALERGFGQAPYGEHSQAICGLEVVLANGEVVRTGMGAIGDGRAWHVYKGGFGPTLDGLFMQSNLGIVTKMGLWLLPEPESFRAVEVSFARDEDFVEMIETLRPLKVRDTIQGSARAANAVRVAQGVSQRSRWTDVPGPLSRDTIARIVDELGIGWWNLRFGLFGEDGVVEERFRTVSEAFGRIPGARIVSRRYPGSVTEAEIEPLDRPQAGIPSMMSYAILDWLEGETGHVGFSPLSPLRGRDAARMVEMVRARAIEHGFDYSAGLTCGPRFLNHIFMILFDPGDAEETNRVRRLFEVLVREGAAEGYGEYRTHLEFMDLVAEQYSFGGGALGRLNRSIKDALDPNGILSPGKQGIWPSAPASNGRVSLPASQA